MASFSKLVSTSLIFTYCIICQEFPNDMPHAVFLHLFHGFPRKVYILAYSVEGLLQSAGSGNTTNCAGTIMRQDGV